MTNGWYHECSAVWKYSGKNSPRMSRPVDAIECASSPISTSSIYGCRVGRDVFFSTMVEPSALNTDRHVRIYGRGGERDWQPLLAWKKDLWPMRLFQYGNAFLPDGENSTQYLAVSTAAVVGDDMTTLLYSVGR